MIQTTATCDAIHEAARLIAKRFAIMMAGILRDEELGECEREAYLLSREVIEAMESSRGK
jgi:hypothetical protein